MQMVTWTKEIVWQCCRMLNRTGFFHKLGQHYQLVVREVEIPLRGLPEEFAQFRICHLSDLHLGEYCTPKELQRLVETVNELQADVICFTGDLIDREPRFLAQALPFLQKLHAGHGKLAVLGNHDYRAGVTEVTTTLKEAGFQVLVNQHLLLQRGEAQLAILGLDDCLYGLPDIDKALEGLEAGAIALLLVHEPDYADQIISTRIVLQLSGHSHGGQVRLPRLGALLTPQLGSKYSDGLYRLPHRDLLLYTSRGLGSTIMPLRIGCPPEVVMLTLTCAE